MRYYLLFIMTSSILFQNNLYSDKAFDLVVKQCSFGPRYPGSSGHNECKDFIINKLSNTGPESIVDIIIDDHKIKDPLTSDSVMIYNIFGRINPEKEERILLIAHWDTRRYADKDPNPLNHKKPVLGANDGASGVAVLLSLLDNFNKDKLSNIGIDFLFADAEDMGLYGNPKTWAIGSKLFSRSHPTTLPQFGICIDMVADKDLNIQKERYSYNMAPQLIDYIWDIAIKKGYKSFKEEITPAGIIDDHLSFSMMTQKPSINIIDLDYSYWHTIQDIPENISKNSLGIVIDVLTEFIYNYDKNVK